MDNLVAQFSLSLAAYFAAIGLLGLLLGWWLGRSGVKRSARESSAEFELQLATVAAEHEQAALEVGRLADQLAGSKIELEEARERTSKVIASLSEAEEQLVIEQQSVASFQPLLTKRDERLEKLRTEQAAQADRIEALEEDLRRSQIDSESMAGRLSAAEARASELEDGAQRAVALEEEFEAKARESATLETEVERLQRLTDELRQSLARATGHHEDLGRARQQLVDTRAERDRVVEELATLSRRLEEVELERETHDRAADAARRELERQRQLLGERDERIAALEGSRVGRFELEVEIRSLRSELESNARRAEDLHQRMTAAEAARVTAEAERDHVSRELENLLSAPLIDVDRMATVKPVSFELTSNDDALPAFAPELLEVPRGAADDLQRISGIGEVLAQTLNSLGIYHYRQIAGWSESDIQWVAAHIDTFSDRILRDEWREQAAQLESEKRGGQA